MRSIVHSHLRSAWLSIITRVKPDSRGIVGPRINMVATIFNSADRLLGRPWDQISPAQWRSQECVSRGGWDFHGLECVCMRYGGGVVKVSNKVSLWNSNVDDALCTVYRSYFYP